jgi:hypothetical protein
VYCGDVNDEVEIRSKTAVAISRKSVIKKISVLITYEARWSIWQKSLCL